MSSGSFFDSPRQQSIIKTQLVTKYFVAWSTIMLAQTRHRRDNRIAYVDLFSGPGQFSEGLESTPLWVLHYAIGHHELRQRLVTSFNDKDASYVASLRQAISTLDGIDLLRHEPEVSNDEVGTEMAETLRQLRLVPTLFFVDPWGYKGLSLQLIGSAIRNWGCDCIFFFNYNRINPGITNSEVRDRMIDLFEDRYDDLARLVVGMHPEDRERAIIESLSDGLRSYGGRFVTTFCFRSVRGARTSHYIIFVSKDCLGYKIMKEVMAGLSSSTVDGIASFVHDPDGVTQLRLLNGSSLTESIDFLRRDLPRAFAGRTVSVADIFCEHSVGTRYTLKNYRTALLDLERGGVVEVNDPEGKRRKGMAERLLVSFPT